MTILNIVEWPAKALETKALPVSGFDEELRQLVKDMHATMDASHGIGLAANQVGILKRVLTIYIPYQPSDETLGQDEPAEAQASCEEKRWWHDRRFSLVNPLITKRVGRVKSVEGCLSFPDIYDYVDRSEKVSIAAKDEEGKDLAFEADGLFAICLQHEIDHLDGIVFVNRMSRLKAQMIKKKLRKRQLVGSLNQG